MLFFAAVDAVRCVCVYDTDGVRDTPPRDECGGSYTRGEGGTEMQPARERVTEATMGGQGEENTTREGAEWCRWREKMGSMDTFVLCIHGPCEESLHVHVCESERVCASREAHTRERGFLLR